MNLSKVFRRRLLKPQFAAQPMVTGSVRDAGRVFVPSSPSSFHAALLGVQDGGGNAGWPCPPRLSPELQTGERGGQPIAHPVALQPETFRGERRDEGSPPSPTVVPQRGPGASVSLLWLQGRQWRDDVWLSRGPLSAEMFKSLK